ncbi:polysaccharide deacetylase family protein [Anaerolineales bacterium HSG6]|nr:polysaccharide deacetylase family protein [Anaerolineales bacterium HSG6]MDM8530390.1 polysaccharide deacetylase family protein [Anaerolineales bacterium HSG25]
MTRIELNKVPILITWDVDPDLWLPLEKRRWALETAMNLCHDQAIPATFYITAQPANIYQTQFKTLKAQQHEIGCHGWTHGTEENYDRMSSQKQRLYIKLATEYLQAITGETLRAFRSPRVKTSAITQNILAEQGYLSDSSVCSQRADLISSNLVNTDWLLAPRRPYHPQTNHAFKAGDLPIWQVPISAMALPFISSTMQVLGVAPMKRFFDLLYQEAKYTGKPIIYLAHPIEFVGRSGKNRKRSWKAQLKPQYFTPTYIRAHGIRLRNLLYRFTPVDFLGFTIELFAYMASFPDVTFMTMTDYINKIDEKTI